MGGIYHMRSQIVKYFNSTDNNKDNTDTDKRLCVFCNRLNFFFQINLTKKMA